MTPGFLFSDRDHASRRGRGGAYPGIFRPGKTGLIIERKKGSPYQEGNFVGGVINYWIPQKVKGKNNLIKF